MKPNIFKIDPGLGPEDALTAYWHYVLNVVPGLGQKFVDAVCGASGLTTSAFIGAVDHPSGDSRNHPDLLVQCSDWKLLFEHKLDSPVGPRQLHRYVEVAEERGWKLALMAAARTEVAEEVRRSPTFVSPTDSDSPSHFLWQDLHPILSSVDHHLAREFAEFLEWWGLGRVSWAGMGDPSIDEGGAGSLLALYDSLRAVFSEPGVQCRKSASSLIYQIRTPFPPVHLVNVGPLLSVAQENPTLRGPVMGVWVWIRRHGTGQNRVLLAKDSDIKKGAMSIVVKNHEDAAGLPYDRAVHNERSYYVPLDQILQPLLKQAEHRLVQFDQAAVRHLRQDVTGTVPNKRLQPAAAAATMRPPRLKRKR